MTHSATDSLPMYCRLRDPGNSFPLLNVLDLLPAQSQGPPLPTGAAALSLLPGGRGGNSLAYSSLSHITATCSLTQPFLPHTSSTPEP